MQFQVSSKTLMVSSQTELVTPGGDRTTAYAQRYSVGWVPCEAPASPAVVGALSFQAAEE